MPNCRVSKGTSIAALHGSYAGEKLVVEEVIRPTGGERRGCEITKARPPVGYEGIRDWVYLNRDQFQVLTPLRPKGCMP